MADYSGIFKAPTGPTSPLSAFAPSPEQLAQESTDVAPTETGGLVGETEKFIRGERGFITPTGTEGFWGKAKNFIVNDLLGGALQHPFATAERIVGAPIVVPQLVTDQKNQAGAMQAQALLDQRLAQKIKELQQRVYQTGDPQAQDALNEIKKTFSALSYVPTTNELPVPAAYDVTNKEALFQGAETGLLVGLAATHGFFEIPFFGEAKAALGAGAQSLDWAAPNLLNPALSSQLRSRAANWGIRALGGGAEVALYNAVATEAEHRASNEPKLTNAERLSAGAGGFAFGAAAVTIIDGLLPKIFSRKAAAKLGELFRDLADSSEMRALRGLDETSTLKPKTIINTKGVKPQKAVGDFADNTERLKFENVGPADSIRTPEGIVGQVLDVISVPSSPELSEALRASSASRATLGAGNAAANKQLRGFAKAAEAEVDRLVTGAMEKDMTAGEKIDLLRLRVKSGVPGEFKTLTVAADDFMKGGIVRAREVFEPVVKDAGSERVANNLAADQLARDRGTINSTEGKFAVEVSQNKAMKKRLSDLGITWEDNMTLLNEEKFSPKRANPSNYVRLDATTLRMSGIDPTFLHQAEAALDADRLAIFNQLRDGTAAVLKEAGLKNPENFKESVALAFDKKQRERIAALSSKLFRAAEGNLTPGEHLTQSEKALVATWKSVAKDLLRRVNQVLVAQGKKPIKGRENYMTHILTAQAKASLLLNNGTVPQKLLRELYGSRIASMITTKNATTVLDNLLKGRKGVLPIQQDFFNAVNTAVQTHTNFIHMQPELTKLNALIDVFEFRTKGMFPTNVSYMRSFADRLAGKSKAHEVVRSIDQTIQEALMVDQWSLGSAKFKNPFHAIFPKDWFIGPLRDEAGKIVNVPGIGTVMGPTKGVIKLMDAIGPSQLPRRLKRLLWMNQLSFSIPYMTTNLSQYWTLTVPMLRGTFAQRYKSAVVGAKGALVDYFDSAAREKHLRAGILNDQHKFEMTEMGDQSAVIDGITVKPGHLGKILNWTSSASEFQNRVASFQAAHHNMISTSVWKGPKEGWTNNYWKELNVLTDGELFREADRLSLELSKTSQFKFGVTHRAPISDNPVLSMWDQFNSFTRNWWGVVKGMNRNLVEDPEFRSAWSKAMSGKGYGDLFDILSNKETLTGKRGEIIRWALNNATLLTATSLMGISFRKAFMDTFMGGGTRLLQPTMDVYQGIKDNDQARTERGIVGLTLPPSVPPVFDAVRDVFDLFDGKEKKTIKKFVLSKYSPFTKASVELQALKAALTGLPQPVHNQKTGDVQYMIEPNDALNKLVFGTSGITDAEAMHELDLIAQGRASDDRKARKLALESNQHTDDFLSGDYQTNVKKWNEMVMRGTMSQDMAKAIIQNWRERKIFASGSVEKQLTSLSPESRAEFIRRIGKGMSAEDWNSMVYSYTAQGLISPAVAGDLINNPVQSSAVSKVAKAAGLVALGLGAAALLKGRGVGKVAEVLGREGGELAGKAAPKGLGPTERMGGAPGAAFRHEVFPMNEWDKLPESFKNEVRQAAEKGDKPVDTELPAVIRRDIEKIVVDNNPFIYHENPKDHEDITLAILKATTPVMMEDAKRMPDFAEHVLETTTAAFRDKKALTFVDLRTAIEQVLIGGNIAGVRFPYSDMAKVLDMEEKGIIRKQADRLALHALRELDKLGK